MRQKDAKITGSRGLSIFVFNVQQIRGKELTRHSDSLDSVSYTHLDVYKRQMYGCVQFYKAAKKAGIKPIIGCEVYVATRTRFDKVNKIDGNNHLILLDVYKRQS